MFPSSPASTSSTLVSSAFLRFWWTDLARDNCLARLDSEDLLSLRLVCHDFSIRTASALFQSTTISFRSATFTRPARMAALQRIGPYIKTLTFSMPHTDDTFLPPLLDPLTGVEENFIYHPQISPSRMSTKYGSPEVTDLLVNQYPPLFHAATNIPSFVTAISSLPNIKHLKISTPGQNPTHRYRRSAVDYALISLRIAIEHCSLPDLQTLTLAPIHPSALFYLRPQTTYGASPLSPRRWRQIHHLSIAMSSFPYEHGDPTDHLKHLHNYLTSLTSLRSLDFKWLDGRGPCPLSLPSEPCLLPTLTARYPNANPKTSSSPPLKDLHFKHLRYMELESAVLDAPQISSFISLHRSTLQEFKFEDVRLRSGDWDAALEPLSSITGNEKWKERCEEVCDVPVLMLSPEREESPAVKRASIISRCVSIRPLKGPDSAKPKRRLFGEIESVDFLPLEIVGEARGLGSMTNIKEEPEPVIAKTSTVPVKVAVTTTPAAAAGLKRTNTPAPSKCGMNVWKRGQAGRAKFLQSQDHMKKFFKTSVFSWR